MSEDLAIVVAHGFTGDPDRPHVRRAAGVFAQYAAMITFSFLGQGAFGGHSTVGDREVLDPAAVAGHDTRTRHAENAAADEPLGADREVGGLGRGLAWSCRP